MIFLQHSDLAVLRVSESYPEFHNSIESVDRSNQLLVAGTLCRFVAWGRFRLTKLKFDISLNSPITQGAATNVINAAIQPDLRVMNAPTILTATCNQPTIHANRVLASHICAGSVSTTAPASGACVGNVGSGLYCNNQLTGVLTFGTSCGAINNPGVYVDVRQYQGNRQDSFRYIKLLIYIV